MDNLVAIYQRNISPDCSSYYDENQRFFYTGPSTTPFICYWGLDFIGVSLSDIEVFSRDLLSCINHLTPFKYTAHKCGEYTYVRCAVSSAPCYPLYDTLINGKWPSLLEYWLEDTAEGY